MYQSSHVYQDCTNSVPIVKNSQKTVRTAKMTIGVPIVTCLPRLYQQCTNRQKQSKDSKNSKNHRWCTNRHMSTQSPPNTQSPHLPNTQYWMRGTSRCCMSLCTRTQLGLLAAVAWPAALIGMASVIDNPWSVCTQRSWLTGRQLAEVLLSRQQVCVVA